MHEAFFMSFDLAGYLFNNLPRATQKRKAEKKQTNRVIVAVFYIWVANLDDGSTRSRYQTDSSVC